jgi:VIT1/CCC1 family predicted Fe2+/Mn2+ transporter
MPHAEHHRSHRVGWLRASVLGANDGVTSVASLVLGVAAAHASSANVAVAGVAAWVAGAMSMAAGEFVSVSSQSDTEKADLAIEREGLEDDPAEEREELASIYVERGLEPRLAMQVATQLMARDALGAHARDELGISEITKARPFQAAFASAASFTVGALVPLLTVLIMPAGILAATVAAVSALFLAVLGGVAAHAGGANIWIGSLRVLVWGILAMAITAAAGLLIGGAPV